MKYLNSLPLVFHYLFFIGSSFLILSCAHQVSPQGGPPDTEPPRIISTYPAPYTIHFGDTRIALEFDEYVEHRSVEESIFISPYVGDLEFDWSGTEVEIAFSEDLRKNTTYVVNVGTDAVDLRNRNRMAQTFTLAFSTGDEIDHGAIQGRVFSRRQGDTPVGVMVFAYLLENLNPDTLNPQTQKPDYISQTGKGGEFTLRHLAFGSYRVFAVKDEYRNLIYDPEADEFGVPFRDIRLTPADTMAFDILIRLSKEDTTKPRLIKVETLDQNHVAAEFSESLDTSSIRRGSFSIVDTIDNQGLPIVSLFPSATKQSSFMIVTENQDSTKTYRLTVLSVKDLAGNSVNVLANRLTFEGSRVQDTVGLRRLGWSPKDSSLGISLDPEIQFFLTDAVQRVSGDEMFQLYDSTGRTVPLVIHWMNDAVIRITPKNRLAGLMWHKLKVDMTQQKAWNGRLSKDSVITVRFETIDADALSSIEGVVVDQNDEGMGKVFIQAESVGAREVQTYTVSLKQPGLFALRDVKEGRYILSAYRDTNGNDKYDPGSPFPFKISERFTVYQDTLKLRARWPVEGVRIDLK